MWVDLVDASGTSRVPGGPTGAVYPKEDGVRETYQGWSDPAHRPRGAHGRGRDGGVRQSCVWRVRLSDVRSRRVRDNGRGRREVHRRPRRGSVQFHAQGRREWRDRLPLPDRRAPRSTAHPSPGGVRYFGRQVALGFGGWQGDVPRNAGRRTASQRHEGGPQGPRGQCELDSTLREPRVSARGRGGESAEARRPLLLRLAHGDVPGLSARRNGTAGLFHFGDGAWWFPNADAGP